MFNSSKHKDPVSNLLLVYYPNHSYHEYQNVTDFQVLSFNVISFTTEEGTKITFGGTFTYYDYT